MCAKWGHLNGERTGLALASPLLSLFQVLQVGVNVQCSTSREGDVLALFTGFGAGHFILCSCSLSVTVS